MATVEDVLAAIKHVTECTGDPNAWRSGLTGDELAVAATLLAAGPRRLDGLLAGIRHRHPDLFGPARAHQDGEAADAIRAAGAALAQQGSATAQLDLQVVAAILNARQTTVDGRTTLTTLQHDIETAVRSRTDLDTPAGARDFQRFLIGKLGEIRAVVAGANLDDTSRSALMAALTSLYRSATDDSDGPTRDPSPPGAEQDSPAFSDTEPNPYLDALSADELGAPIDDASAQPPSPPSNAPVATPPNPGGMAAPPPNWGSPGGFGLPGLPAGDSIARPARGSDDAEPEYDKASVLEQPLPEDDVDNRVDDEPAEVSPALEPPAGPVTVALPDGETITAASPQLAAVIKAAADGTPIADAFRQQGISIPAPGTAVADPIDPSQVQPADIGIFTTRYALALGHGEALVDGQIQNLAVVTGPSFLGWQHPPVPAIAGPPAKSDPPVPTRPAYLTVAAQ